MSSSWNLLNYPALRQQRRKKHRVITSLAGLALGTGMTWATVQGLEGALKRWRLQHSQLQAQWIQLSQQIKQEQQKAVAFEKKQQQVQHLSGITQQHQAWAALNEALRSEAADVTWRLSRLQMESGQLELSGWSRDFDSLSATRQKLTTHLQNHVSEPEAASPLPGDLVRQTSIATRGAHTHVRAEEVMGIEVVWVSPWPVFKPWNAIARPSDTRARP
jgi:hypothetical protein